MNKVYLNLATLVFVMFSKNISLIMYQRRNNVSEKEESN